MFNTFNMGVGMTITVAKADADAALALLREGGEPGAYVLGEIVPGEERRGAMVKTAVLVSGGGTNLQALLDAKGRGEAAPWHRSAWWWPAAPDAYALERAEKAGVPCAVLRKGKEKPVEQYGRALLELLQQPWHRAGGAGGLPDHSRRRTLIQAYPERILNIHPSLIPSFCGAGFYGLKVHEAALAKGVKVTGATVHFVNEIPDGGEIIAPEGGGGAPRRHAGSIAAAGDGAGRMDSAAPGRGGRGRAVFASSKEETACS